MLSTFVHHCACAAAISLLPALLTLSEAHAQAVFKYPRVDGFPMDGCLDWAADCEQTAADYFCGIKGYTTARNWQTEDSSSSTKTMRTKEICDTSQWICGTFSFIDCATPRSPLTPTKPISLGTFSGTKQYTTGPESGTTYTIALEDLSEHNGQLTGRYSLTDPQGSTKIFDGTKWESEIRFNWKPPANPSCTHLFQGVLVGDNIAGDFTTQENCNGNGKLNVSWDLSLQTSPIREGQVEVGVIAGGLGVGDVISIPAGIACPSNTSSQKCRYFFPGAVTLTAIPHAGSTFTGWSGACQGLSDKCTISGYNQSLSVGAGFDVDALTPPEELTVNDVIQDSIKVVDFVNDVAEQISGKEAFRRYNWLAGPVTNASNNLRGMVINAQSRRVFMITGKINKALTAFNIADSATENFCNETLVRINEILSSPTQDKALAINLELAKLPVKMLADIAAGSVHDLNFVLYHTRFINPTYWLNPLSTENAIDTTEYWVTELETSITEGIDKATGVAYELLEVSSDRFPEYLYINDLLSAPCRYM